MSYNTPHKKYLDLASATVGIRDKKVLEVGGSTPPTILVSYRPSEWESVNLDAQSVTQFNAQARALATGGYSAVCEDITTLDRVDSYDLVYSINAFEHIHSLDVAFDRMFRALKQGGHLFTLFGPIWSSDVGHHLSLTTDEKRELHFLDGSLAPWEHLTSPREAIHSKLASLHGEGTARRAVTYIFDYPDLNRLSESDYMKIVKESGFSPALVLRNRCGTAPNVPGATNTREFLMLLKKGSVTTREKCFCFARFALKFGEQQIRMRF